MNYLAHAYLSFGQPGILVGNMISDFIKGKKKFDYPAIVQQGITLHRMIDTFTDDHPVTKEAKIIFKPYVGLYAGAFMDVVYDHFLALDNNEFTADSLDVFAQRTYAMLYSHTDVLPPRFAAMLPYMKQQNWLCNYSTTDGIEKSFAGVVRRAAYLNSSQAVYEAFLQNYKALGEYYAAFFPLLKVYAFEQLNILTGE
jgi:acyl carrier protein phosphodiesterase